MRAGHRCTTGIGCWPVAQRRSRPTRRDCRDTQYAFAFSSGDAGIRGAVWKRDSHGLTSKLVRNVLPAPRGCEPRGVIWVRTFVQGYSLDIVTTHLGVTGLERRLQREVLLGTDWIGRAGKLPHLIVAGDFNCLPRSRTWNRFALALGGDHPHLRNRAAATFPSTMPLLRPDHIFVTPAIEIVAMYPVRTPLTRIASDHLPLMMEFNLRQPDWHEEKPL